MKKIGLILLCYIKQMIKLGDCSQSKKGSCVLSSIAKVVFMVVAFSYAAGMSMNIQAQENLQGGTVSLGIGSAKGKLGDDYNSDANSQNTRGLIFNYGFLPKIPLRLDVATFSGGVEGTIIGAEVGTKSKETVLVSEHNLGVSYYFFNKDGIRAYGGGGLALVSVTEEVEFSGYSGKASGSGSGNGLYFSLGGEYVFSGGFTLGLNVRDSNSKFKGKCDSSSLNDDFGPITCQDLESTEENYGLTRTMLTLGYSWE